MSLQSIIIIIIGIILAIIIIKFITKVLAKIIAVLLVVAAIGYLLFFWNEGLVNLGKKDFILYKLEDRYCTEGKNEIKCECIIMPLKRDIESKYTPEDIEELKEDRMKSMEVILESFEENTKEIKDCLKENNAMQFWDDFVEDLKKLELGKKFKELFEDLKNIIKEENKDTNV